MPKIYKVDGSQEFEPVVFFKAGVPGGTEQEFGDLVAHGLGAVLVSQDRLKQSIYADRTRRNRKCKAEVKQTVRDRTLEALVRDEDVVCDAFFNTPKGRAERPVQWAKDTEATVVAFAVEVDVKLARERMERWIDTKTLIAPRHSWGDGGPLKTIDKLHSELVLPSEADELVDIVIPVDGSLGLEAMVQQTLARIADRGIETRAQFHG